MNFMIEEGKNRNECLRKRFFVLHQSVREYQRMRNRMRSVSSKP
jgi:hypothetical protein